MNILLVTIQFERGSTWQHAARKVSSFMQKRNATYVSHGIYQVMAQETAEQLCDVICREVGLTDRDFIGVFPNQPPWSVRGAFKRGVHQPEWPAETFSAERDA